MIRPDLDTCCRVLHESYERAALEAGWETQIETRVEWADVPEANKVTMRQAVAFLLDYIQACQPRTPDV